MTVPDHIYSGEVNKIWPVSSKTELLHILAVFVLLKGLAGSAEKILLLQAGGGRGVCCGSVEWKVVWKRVAGPRPPGQVCVAAERGTSHLHHHNTRDVLLR